MLLLLLFFLLCVEELLDLPELPDVLVDSFVGVVGVVVEQLAADQVDRFASDRRLVALAGCDAGRQRLVADGDPPSESGSALGDLSDGGSLLGDVLLGGAHVVVVVAGA